MADTQKVDIKTVVSGPERFPNDSARRRHERLVGVEAHAKAVARDLHQLFHPHLAARWAERHFGGVPIAVRLLDDLVPLIIFEGDVGTGKSALAETIGDAVARTHDYEVQLFKMSTQVRGHGYVGQMGSLLSLAFKHVSAQWERTSTPVVFIIDEADSLLTARSAEDHHHEDKSGVNTILQQLDDLSKGKAQVAVIAITNRIGVLDPAVRRRATAIYRFDRPNTEQRRALFANLLHGFELSETDLDALADASAPRPGANGGRSVPFSYSDLTLRILIPQIRECVDQDCPLTLDALIRRLGETQPTPSMESA
ncbi:MAG: AAA family ATPase [Myxococcota bacterium]